MATAKKANRAEKAHRALKRRRYMTAFMLIDAIRSPKYTQAIDELRHEVGVPVYCHRRKRPYPPVYSLSMRAPRV